MKRYMPMTFKLGFLEATVDFALKKPELRDEFLKFIKSKVSK